MSKIFLIHGFVGAGKTTFAKKLADETQAVRFTLDEWMISLYGNNPPADLFSEYEGRVKKVIWQLAQEFLSRGQDVIFDYGFWKRLERDVFRTYADEIGAECILYDVTCSINTMKQRVQKRTDEMPPGALFIDDNAFDILQKRFESLSEDECRITINTDK